MIIRLNRIPRINNLGLNSDILENLKIGWKAIEKDC